jgi:signal transduction histidine kinase
VKAQWLSNVVGCGRVIICGYIWRERSNSLKVQVDVESTVRRTLKMFESELQADGIQMVFLVEKSYQEARLDMVYCDPVRLTQIFINLLTNVSE